MQLKRWESPRREGRNHKGKGGSARQRQLKKRNQALRQKLSQNLSNEAGEVKSPLPLRFVRRFRTIVARSLRMLLR